MGSLSNFGENALLNHLTRNSAYSPVATLYLALATADPTDTATGASMNEVANSGAYARTAITFGAAASRRVTQSGTVTFTAATGSWGTVTHWAIVDSATYGAGNVLAYGALGSSRSIVNGNTPSVASTEVWVELTASNGISNYAANGFLDRMFRNQAFTVSATYVALCTAAPTDSSTGSTITEPSGNNYSRLLINANGGGAPAWGAVSGGSVSLSAATFPTPSGSWGTISHHAITDASTTGNVLYYGAQGTSNLVAASDTVTQAFTINQS
jgi:hypothetical protein